MRWTDEHQQLRSSYLKFIEQHIEPHLDAWEEAESFPAHELFEKLGDAGFLGIHRDPEWGGQGLDYSYSVVAAEALGHCSAGGVPMAIGVQTDMCTPALANFGSDALKREFLAPSIAGKRVGCLGVSEPGAGSDVAAIRTAARSDGEDWVIDGTKMWITSGLQADWCCLLANTSDGPRYENKSLIVVPLDARGIERQKIKKTGMWCSDTAQLFFDNVRVPKRHTIGREGTGFMLQMLQFQEERLWGAANVVGSLDAALEITKAYTRERKAFGKPLLDNQWIHFRLAELSTEIEALRALVGSATDQYVAGENVTRLASMAKLKAGRLVREVADTCLQFWGGMGYAWDSRISRLFRDGRLVSIGAGADEVMLGIICKLEGTLPSKSGA
ncbi:MAG TPA: acyl-CoA dehydrogenase family protein [Myxococcales bacterium LLY-WYZ-16_1]|nr:acyl-CoA dehydrogenase family protein [Myxococcales bacterium LLY-WYZ-16_1]